ncbi:uncharacterized protein CIMG_13449 [Coccidioides immitis RS]|uniref:Uncharacterized protein n=1 Tax=Coccidioides immitis (strain RS) TaxID=246410 RepID=J3KF93_COCIM|nr:uncharacterized protein CIMG_13449 [Coccidioides immitis RS]EAS34270.3 hypothetical protein CIMG_13449 [Coccidioides immitis RS]
MPPRLTRQTTTTLYVADLTEIDTNVEKMNIDKDAGSSEATTSKTSADDTSNGDTPLNILNKIQREEIFEEKKACLQKNLADIYEQNKIHRLQKQIEYKQRIVNDDFSLEFLLCTRLIEESDDLDDVKSLKASYYHGKSLVLPEKIIMKGTRCGQD